MEIFQTFAKIYKVIRVKYIYTCDGVKGMLPPYLALSHIEFKVEGVWEAGSGFWLPPPVPFFTETRHKTLLWEKACLYQGKEHPCLWRQTERKILQTGLCKFPPVYCIYFLLLNLPYLLLPALHQGFPWWLRWWRICLQYRRLKFDCWVRKIPGEGSGYPLQYSCLKNSMERSLTVTNTFTFTLHQTA